MGDFGRAKALTEACAYSGCDAIKWQLFEGAEVGPQNIALPYKWLPKLACFGKELGVEVFASVWDRRGLTALLDCGCSSVKFAYSQNENDDLIFDTLVFGVSVPGYASLMVGILFLGGLQLLSLGVMGEYMARIFTEVKARPLYFVAERVGFE